LATDIDSLNVSDTVSVYDKRDGKTYYGFLSRKIHFRYSDMARAYTILLARRINPCGAIDLDLYLEFDVAETILNETRLVITEKIRKNFSYI
jgi:hypothetical protein